MLVAILTYQLNGCIYQIGLSRDSNTLGKIRVCMLDGGPALAAIYDCAGTWFVLSADFLN